jgi:hypothetical protein
MNEFRGRKEVGRHAVALGTLPLQVYLHLLVADQHEDASDAADPPHFVFGPGDAV